jgi:UDP-N-acetylglucosamine--N-acetylmuramyl-(pentapeptide) pyrophosphoryl-undecaprenol N-acetylglucosamine transferase
MENIAAQLSARDFNVLWQTGQSAHVSELQSKFLNVPNVHVTEYIYDMERAYAAADLVVCRAGASSLAELARLGKPAVLIPWSGAAANHQEANARSFEQAGAAYVVTDAEVKAKLFETVLELLNGGDRLRQFSEAMKQRDNPNAASVVARWLIERIP